ncbi:MAG: ATP-binding cassette domain-containing protein [Steroidobacteraceae bacterium]
MIEVRQLAKRFGQVAALRDISFAARDGRVTGLLGPNGAGKSTCLRILYTAIQADSGSATIDGHDCTLEPLAVRRCLGVLPHATGLYPNLTARENVRYYGELHGLAGEPLERGIEALVARLDLADIADRPAHGLSQGQRIKVALARALVHNPRNVILDEPTNGLDVMAIRTLRDLIRGLRDEGCCVLLSSHVMQEIGALCDDLVIIGKGRVVLQGSPDEVRTATGCDNLEEAFVQLSQTEQVA